jgi:glycosyltransferase involved in cell wall biosynthesis
MRIGFDGKVLTRRIGGVGRCAINLLQAMVSMAAAEGPEVEFVIFTAPQTDPHLLQTLGASICHRFRRVKSSLLRASLLLPAAMSAERLDIFHGLDQSSTPFFGKRVKHVISVHDVLPWSRPWAFPFKHRLVTKLALARVRKQADLVLVPSEAVREEVVRYLKVDKGRILVRPWGCEARFRPAGDPGRVAQVLRRYQLAEPYILFVGTIEPRKDLLTLVRAFAQLRTLHHETALKLVIAGGRGWGEGSVVRAVQALALEEDVIFTGFVEEDDLPDLYRGAALFVYPSLYEGFGLPILEAMACGVPVITSNVSSMPEVAGQAAILVEPKQPEALAAAMASVLNDGQLRDTLRRRGLERAGRFSWEDVARQVLAVYRALA